MVEVLIREVKVVISVLIFNNNNNNSVPLKCNKCGLEIMYSSTIPCSPSSILWKMC